MEKLSGWRKWRGVGGMLYASSPVEATSLSRDVLRSTDELELDRMIAEWDAAHPEIIGPAALNGAPWAGWRPPWDTSRLS